MKNSFISTKQLFLIKMSVFLLSLFSLNSSFATTSTPPSDDLFDLIISRIKEDVEGPVNLKKISESIDAFLPKYKTKDGSFIDVDYDSRVRTNWPPLQHINRMKDLVFAYTMPGNKYYEDEVVFDMIENGMQYWYDKNPHCSNWWYNQVGEPQRVGVVLLQMRHGKKKLSTDLEKNTIERLAKDGGDPAKQQGANRTDVALHWLYRACLTKDAELLKKTLTFPYSPIKYVTGEGIQHDNSYFQHGQQLYIGGYGDELIKGILLFASYTEGTEYALPKDKLEILSKFFIETYLSVIRGQYFLFDVLGRGMSRKNNTFKKGSSLFVRKMKKIDSNPLHQLEYDQALARLNGEQKASYGIEPRNRHYFRADYTLHTRPGYAFDVRMVSTRTVRCEMGNGENLKTYFLSDGCTNIALDGNEYAEIFPVWNWTRIPGVTCPQMQNIPKDEAYGGRGKAKFAGAVSDSLYSVTSYSYYDKFQNVNTGASKSWFAFDNEIVCLGSDIQSAADFEINTTVNQCLKKGDIHVSSNNKTTSLSAGHHQLTNNVDWVHHDKVAYFFPEGGNVSISNKTQKGTWYEINNTQVKDKVEKDVFTLWFNHGKFPQKRKYAYIIVPNKDNVADVKNHPIDNIEILVNSDSLQVVRHKALNIMQMVFFKAASFSHEGFILKTDKPCALMLKNLGTESLKLYIADPLQAQEKITLRATIPSVSSKEKQVVCDFSASNKIYAGQTKLYLINERTEDAPEDISVSNEVPVVDKIRRIEEFQLTADAFVQKGQADKNFGDERRVIVKNDNMSGSVLGTDRKTFLKFAVPRIQLSENDSLGKIELRLYLLTTNETADQVYWTLSAVEDQNWSESTLTYNNMPKAGETIARLKGVLFQGEKDGPIRDENYIKFDITDYVKEQMNNSDKEYVTLMLYNNQRGSGKHDSQFASKENENVEKHPKLFVSVLRKNNSFAEVELVKADRMLTVPAAGLHNVKKEGTFKLSVKPESKNTNDLYLLINGIQSVDFKSKHNGEYYFEVHCVDEDMKLSIHEKMSDFSADNKNLVFYPNPTKAGRISYVESENNDIIEIYNLSGNRVAEYRAVSNLTPISINDKGTYIIRVKSTEGKAISSRFVVN